MDQGLKQRIQQVVEEQWRGCVVDADGDDQLRITNKHGRVISSNAPPSGWQDGLDNDDKIRTLIKNVCR